MTRAFISLTSDFGVQSQGVGIMEGVARGIAPDAYVLHLMHGLPSFDILAAARTLETVSYLPCGAHVCVCDPGVGSSRKALIIEVKRGDYLIGPDNGVLIPASRVLGGIVRTRELANPKYMRHPVSAIFHGRDIFTPAAAYVVTGTPLHEFGPEVPENQLAQAAYAEAVMQGRSLHARVIQINKFGSAHLNIRQEVWDGFTLRHGDTVTLMTSRWPSLPMPYGLTFSDVPVGKNIILKDDFGRIAVAINQGSFAERYGIKIGDDVSLVLGKS